MTIQLLIAPAASGKTQFVLEMARQRAAGLQAEVRVCAATRLQARAWQRRLAEAGGAIGVHVYTFDSLTAAILSQAGAAVVRLSDPIRFRLIRGLLAQLPLTHYAPLIDKAGFVQVLSNFIQELKAERITPAAFQAAVDDYLPEPRLAELALIYDAYQQTLLDNGWADWVGQTWLASEILGQQPEIGADWPLLIVDGFDDFTEAQLALLRQLSQRAGETVFTLSGPAEVSGASRYRRYQQTRLKLESCLGVQAEPLPTLFQGQRDGLRRLSAGLFGLDQAELSGGENGIEMVALPDRAAEVRAAMRWLKGIIVAGGASPGEVAITARDIGAYWPYILETAAEFGMPVRLFAGRPLGSSPVVAALLGLIGLNLPAAAGGQPRLPRRVVVESWRSPYFDWSAAVSPGEDAPPIGIQPGDAEILDSMTRDGRVTGPLEQWLKLLAVSADPLEAPAEDEAEEPDEAAARASRRQAVKERFHRFWERIQPPADIATMRGYVAWLEDLIGADPETIDPRAGESQTLPHALNLIARIRAGSPEDVLLDLAAMAALKDLLRGLVWAEAALEGEPPAPVSFAAFYAELIGTVQGASYSVSPANDSREILALSTPATRGLSFQAVALMGLAEGEFPTTLSEDPFLRDADRALLSQEAGLALPASTISSEQEYYYDAVSRARERLLLTRPRLADSGADWVASPFWEETARLSGAAERLVTSGELVSPEEAASWPELLESIAANPELPDAREWAEAEGKEWAEAVEAGSRIFSIRESRADSIYKGDLRGLQAELADKFGSRFHWSPSRLEQFRSCGYWFFTRQGLGLEPRQEPAEGTDAAQLGSIYHDIFEAIYDQPELIPPVDDPGLRPFVEAAAAPILDQAPQKQGFRETAYWAQSRQEIAAVVTQSVINLAEAAGGYLPIQVEARFLGWDAVTIPSPAGDGDSFRMGGLIDRVDRDGEGNIRIIDYKLGGESAFNSRAVAEGKKLQLPLYAYAAQEGLKLGPVVEGFYWHYMQGKAGKFRLSAFEGGVRGAIEVALGYAWESVYGARAGYFPPDPADGSCPSYCAAAAYCWHYRPGWGG